MTGEKEREKDGERETEKQRLIDQQRKWTDTVLFSVLELHWSYT